MPDTAELSLGFAIRAEQAATAYQQTATTLHQVVGALTELGIPPEQMQTEQVGLDPVYERDQVLVGYQGTATLRVTLTDLGAVGTTIDRAVAAGANIVRGVSFTVRETKAPDAAATALAVEDAQRQAALLSRSLGVGLGPVWRVVLEPAPGPIGPVMFREAAFAAIPILPGTLFVSRRVRVEYLVEEP